MDEKQAEASGGECAAVGAKDRVAMKDGKQAGFLEWMATRAGAWTGSSWAFALAVIVVLVWAATGPIFKFSDTWQLVINTGTTIVTFLMVFLVQRSQNKESQAVQLKLNELIASIDGASNRLINLEDSTEDELCTLHTHYAKLFELAGQEERITHSHSIAEAEERHRDKSRHHEGARRMPKASAGHDEDAVAAFLRAAERLREVLRRDDALGAAAREALARHGPELAALSGPSASRS